MTDFNLWKSTALSRLREDYEVAKENNLEHYFEVYKDLIQEVENTSIEGDLVDNLASAYLQDLRLCMLYKANGTSKSAGNRLNFIELQLQSFKDLYR